MSEKHKWFDPRASPAEQPLPRLHSGASVSFPDCLRFYKDVRKMKERGRLPQESYDLFDRLCRLTPAGRLARNLKCVLTTLACRPVCDVLKDGLLEQERLALLDLAHLAFPAELQAVAQGLFNIYERQQFIDATQEMFREERTRRWEFPDQ